MPAFSPLSSDETEARLQYANILLNYPQRLFDTLQFSDTTMRATQLIENFDYHENCLRGLQFGLIETTYFTSESWSKVLVTAGATVVQPERSVAFQQSKELFALVVGNPISSKSYKRIGKAAAKMRIIDEHILLPVLYVLGVSLPFAIDPHVRFEVENIKIYAINKEKERQEIKLPHIDGHHDIEISSDDSQDLDFVYHQHPRQAV